MIISLIMFSTILVLVMIGVPIAAALGMTGIVAILLFDPNLLKGAAFTVWANATSFILVSAPLYILMGDMIIRSGASTRFYSGMGLWMRKIPGGLLHTNILACTILSAISGSSVATAATAASVAIPELDKLGYEKKITYGSIAAGGTLGILIPPSISMIIYCGLTSTSVAECFIAGVIPGLIMSFLFMTYIGVTALINPAIAPRRGSIVKITLKVAAQSILDVLPIMLLAVVVFAGLYLGWATPTELAAIGVFFALILLAINHNFNWKGIFGSASYVARVGSPLLFIIIGAQIFSFALYTWGATQELTVAVTNVPLPPLGIWAILAVLLLILGMFIDAISMMVLTAPVMFPIMTGLGYDPVWFCVAVTLLLETGLITPPVGMNLFTIQMLAPGSTLGQIARGSLPFVIILFIGLILVTAFPEIALWLPAQMKMSVGP